MIRAMTLVDAVIVCSDMRSDDATCMRALTGSHPGEWVAVDRWKTNGPAWALVQDGVPWAIGGLSFSNDWAAVAWFIARPGMSPRSWREVIRATRNALALAFDEANPERRHRVEAHVLHGWAGASRLVEVLGFTLEGIRRRAGSAGESIEVWGLTSAPDGRKTSPTLGHIAGQVIGAKA